MIGLGSDKKTIRLFCNLYRSFPVVGRSRTHNPLFQNILFINYTNILLALCCSIWLKALVNHAIWFVFYRTRVRSLFSLVTNWLTDFCLVNLIDVTLMCEGANSKLVEVVTVADADAELLFRLWAQGLVKIFRLKFRQDLKLEFGQFFLLMFCKGYVESKLNLGRARWSWVWSRFWSLSFMERLIFGWDFEVDAWSRFRRWNLIKICVGTCDINSTLGSVVPLAMFFTKYRSRTA